MTGIIRMPGMTRDDWGYLGWTGITEITRDDWNDWD